MKVKNEPQKSDQSTNFDDLDEEDWPSRDSFRVDSDFSDVTIGSSQATETERETIISTSSSTSSKRSYILREILEKTEKAEKPEVKVRELTQQIAEMIKALTQIEALCANTPSHQQEPVSLKSVTTKMPNDTKVEPMTAPTIGDVADAISLNNTIIGIANASPVGHIADDRLLERISCTSDTESEFISPEQLKFTEAISKAMYKELAPLTANRDQTAVTNRIPGFEGRNY